MPTDYDPATYPPFAVTVDLVVLTVREGALQALVVRRAGGPHAGRWALPGGCVRPDEGLDGAARRELAEETGLEAAPAGHAPVHLEQLASYGEPDRDPRMRVVTVAYLALAPDLPTPTAGGDAGEAAFAPVAGLLADPERLAFDHGRILADGVERARAKLEYTTLGSAFCPPEFTVAQLRRVYDIVWGTDLDPRNFHRKATGTPGFLEPAGSAPSGAVGRPAQLFRAGPAQVLYPPILRPRS
ncbi:MAG: NUDIX domain-containing protein [Kineosporiaceae bacterium]